MSGKPAARQTDGTMHGGPITQGSNTVMIGTSGGVACSVCPGGVAVGQPVNPVLGAKVLSGESDFALPGPLPLVFTREYSSYQSPGAAPVGLLGAGWWLGAEVSVQTSQDQLILNDSKGRSIYFSALSAGEVAYSASERLWLVRGGDKILKGAGHRDRLAQAWSQLPEAMRSNPEALFACGNALGPWWVFAQGPSRAHSEAAQGAEPAPAQGAEQAQAPQATRLVLHGIADPYGRVQKQHRHSEGAYQGHLQSVEDGAGRRYELELGSYPGAVSASGHQGWGADSGIRLIAVHLVHDPYADASQTQPKAQPLVQYRYSARGELIQVIDRTGQVKRQFDYDSAHVGRMIGHAYAGRPMSQYRYDGEGRVIHQHNPQGGLDYQFDYTPLQPRTAANKKAP